MHVPRTDPRCGECLRGLATNAARMATLKSGTEIRNKALEEALACIEEDMALGLASPLIANRALRAIQRISGTDDPFEQFKEEELVRAASVYHAVDALIRDDLRSRVELAVLGNTLDFFRDPREVLQEIPELVQQGIAFDKDDLDRLDRFLSQGARRLLYLTDNTGEVFFDLPLYEMLSRRSKSCTLVLKGGPSLNDLTRRELRMSGLEARFGDVDDTGTRGAGIDWEEVSGNFLERVENADLVLAKGMANFETMYPRTLPVPAFFLFRVKCEPIQDMIGVPKGGFVALWKDAGTGES